MAMFLLRRLGLMVLTLWILSLIVFFAGQILPGDPGRAILGPFAAKSAVQALDHQLGVDRPLLTRYLSWLGGILHGDFGTSYTFRTAVGPFIGGLIAAFVGYHAVFWVAMICEALSLGLLLAFVEEPRIKRLALEAERAEALGASSTTSLAEREAEEGGAAGK